MDEINKPAADRPSPPAVGTEAWGHLPARLRALLITGTLRGGAWLFKAFQSDSACEVSLEHVVGIATGLARLRDELYDVVLLLHDRETLDAWDVLGTLRTAAREGQPILVLGMDPEEQWGAPCWEAGGDGYVCLRHTTTRMLLWRIAQARERHLLIAENRRLRQMHQQQLVREHEEASRLLGQQRQLLEDLQSLRSRLVQDAALSGPPDQIPPILVAHYRELLRTYVIMGSGNLSDELQSLAQLFVQSGLGAQHILRLHLNVLEEMVRGLGARSARHVMNRADLLILEAMMNLAESYRQQCWRREKRLVQGYLPGMLAEAPSAGRREAA
ncbi:MAG: hypothetical protein KatS3mg110_0092 [Pirellulaceae bacterium]|nr:MAG: hypothetical protein KatS3mg110_0092 [Pirellulaceae bacterium]